MSQHWTRWYNPDKLAEMEMKELTRHMNTLSNVIKAFQRGGETENQQQIQEITTVIFAINQEIHRRQTKGTQQHKE